MAEKTWGEVGLGGGRQSVPGGTYAVQIKEARPYPQGSLLYLDLEVLAGPEQGKVGQVNLYCPNPGEKATFFFQKKIAGILNGPPAGYLEAIETGEKDRALGILAGAIQGLTCYATLSLRTDGEYAGSNELESTKPIEQQAAPAAPAAAPVAPAPQAAPAPPVAAPAPAAAPVAAAPPVPVAPAPVAVPAADDDVPF